MKRFTIGWVRTGFPGVGEAWDEVANGKVVR